MKVSKCLRAHHDAAEQAGRSACFTLGQAVDVAGCGVCGIDLPFALAVHQAGDFGGAHGGEVLQAHPGDGIAGDVGAVLIKPVLADFGDEGDDPGLQQGVLGGGVDRHALDGAEIWPGGDQAFVSGPAEALFGGVHRVVDGAGALVGFEISPDGAEDLGIELEGREGAAGVGDGGEVALVAAEGLGVEVAVGAVEQVGADELGDGGGAFAFGGAGGAGMPVAGGGGLLALLAGWHDHLGDPCLVGRGGGLAVGPEVGVDALVPGEPVAGGVAAERGELHGGIMGAVLGVGEAVGGKVCRRGVRGV